MCTCYPKNRLLTAISKYNWNWLYYIVYANQCVLLFCWSKFLVRFYSGLCFWDFLNEIFSILNLQFSFPNKISTQNKLTQITLTFEGIMLSINWDVTVWMTYTIYRKHVERFVERLWLFNFLVMYCHVCSIFSETGTMTCVEIFTITSRFKTFTKLK